MPNNLSIPPLDFDMWPVARCDALQEDALLIAMRQWRRVLLKIERIIASVKRLISRKTDQRIRAKKAVYSPCKTVRIYQVRRHADGIYIFYNNVLENGVYYKNIMNFDKKQVILVISLNRRKKNQVRHTAAVVCQWIQAVNKF